MFEGDSADTFAGLEIGKLIAIFYMITNNCIDSSLVKVWHTLWKFCHDTNTNIVYSEVQLVTVDKQATQLMVTWAKPEH